MTDWTKELVEAIRADEENKQRLLQGWPDDACVECHADIGDRDFGVYLCQKCEEDEAE